MGDGVGDGGFGYAPAELATAVQEGINTVIVVFDNGRLGASHNDWRQRFVGRVIGTRLHNPDFPQLAEVYGTLGVKPGSHQELCDALHGALRAQRTVVIEAPMSPNLTLPFQMLQPRASR